VGNLHGSKGKPAGELQILVTCNGKKVTQRKFMEIPVTVAVIEQVEEMAVKDGAVKGISYKDRKGVDWWNLTNQHLSQIFQQRHQV
jgi:hypothetical protein